MGAVLVANSTRPVLHGVSVLLFGNWLGLQSSKPDDKQVNANGDFLLQKPVVCKGFPHWQYTKNGSKNRCSIKIPQ